MKRSCLLFIKFVFLVVNSVIIINANDKNSNKSQLQQKSWSNKFKSCMLLNEGYVHQQLCNWYRDMIVNVDRIIKEIEILEKSCAFGYMFDEKCDSLNGLILDKQTHNLKKGVSFDQALFDWLKHIIDLSTGWKGCLVDNQLGRYHLIEHMYLCAKNIITTIQDEAQNLTQNQMELLKVVDAKLLEGIVGKSKKALDVFVKSYHADIPVNFSSKITLKDKFRMLAGKVSVWKKQLVKTLKESSLIEYSSSGCMQACEAIGNSIKEIESDMKNLSLGEKYFLTEVHENLIFIIQKMSRGILF